MSERYFENHTCPYYPCHPLEHMNCLFCYCPLYPRADCGGQYTVLQGRDGQPVKDCSGCLLPHLPQGYDHILAALGGAAQKP